MQLPLKDQLVAVLSQDQDFYINHAPDVPRTLGGNL